MVEANHLGWEEGQRGRAEEMRKQSKEKRKERR